MTTQINHRLASHTRLHELAQDGPSQMALEDLPALRAIHGSTVLYPGDATSAAKLTAVMADTRGVVYTRTTRGAYPVIYGAAEPYRVGRSKVVRRRNRGRAGRIILPVVASTGTEGGTALRHYSFPVVARDSA